jgi:phosphocarrier protein HPr
LHTIPVDLLDVNHLVDNSRIVMVTLIFLIVKINIYMNMLINDNTKKVTVINELGLHARPAALVAQLALQAKSDIWLIKNDQKADASSIIDILTLECKKGTELILRTENDSDMFIVEKIATLFEKGFTE